MITKSTADALRQVTTKITIRRKHVVCQLDEDVLCVRLISQMNLHLELRADVEWLDRLQILKTAIPSREVFAKALEAERVDLRLKRNLKIDVVLPKVMKKGGHSGTSEDCR